eukprot:UN33129
MGVFPCDGKNYSETTPLIATDSRLNGYGQTSAISERLVLDAKKRGVPVQIFRLGQMTPIANFGRYKTPFYNPNDFWYYFFDGCFWLNGTFPDLDSLGLEFTPVDYAINMIFALSVESSKSWSTDSHCIWHVVNSEQVLYSNVLKWAGSSDQVKIVSWKEWKQLLKKHESENHSVCMLHAMLEEHKNQTTWEYYTVKPFNVKLTESTLKKLTENNLSPPKIDQNIITSWLKAFDTKNQHKTIPVDGCMEPTSTEESNESGSDEI